MTYRFALILALASTCVLPPVARAETLQGAVTKALEQHPTIEAARAVERRIQEERKEERGGFFPDFSASATGGRIFGNNSTTRGLTVSRGEAYSYLWEGSATLTQPLFDGLSTFNRVDAADARLRAQQYSVGDERENLALRAVQSYLNVMRTRTALDSIKNYRETIGEYQDRIALMVDEGAADEAEAAQAKNIALLLEKSLADFEGQVESAEAEYIEIVGQLPDDKMVKPDLSRFRITQTVDEAVEYAKKHHPLILSAHKELEAANFDTEAEQGSLYPELDGELSYLKRDQVEEIGGELVDGRAILRMSWDFNTGGADLARIRKSKAEYSERLANLQRAQREIIRDVRRAYALLEATKKQDKLVKERQQITSDLFETYKVQFEGALVSLLQLMQTENQMFNTKLEAINTHFQYLNAHYTVLASMGNILTALEPASGMEIENAVYQPKPVMEGDPALMKPEDERPQPVMEGDPALEPKQVEVVPAEVTIEQPSEPQMATEIGADPAPAPELKVNEMPEQDTEEAEQPAPAEVMSTEEQIYPADDYIEEPEPAVIEDAAEEPEVEMIEEQPEVFIEPEETDIKKEQIYPVEDYQ